MGIIAMDKDIKEYTALCVGKITISPLMATTFVFPAFGVYAHAYAP
jgi:hypothetical protein